MLRGTWNLPGPGIEPMPPASAGKFFGPPGKPQVCLAFLMESEVSLEGSRSGSVGPLCATTTAGYHMCLPYNRESNRAWCRFVKCRKISGQKLPIIPLWLVFDSFLFGLFFFTQPHLCEHILESKIKIVLNI